MPLDILDIESFRIKIHLTTDHYLMKNWNYYDADIKEGPNVDLEF